MIWPFRRSIAPQSDELAESLKALTGRVRALESERLDLLTEWTKTRDQVIRYMKRAGQLRRYQEQRGQLDDDEEEEIEEEEIDEIRAKFGGRR